MFQLGLQQTGHTLGDGQLIGVLQEQQQRQQPETAGQSLQYFLLTEGVADSSSDARGAGASEAVDAVHAGATVTRAGGALVNICPTQHGKLTFVAERILCVLFSLLCPKLQNVAKVVHFRNTSVLDY